MSPINLKNVDLSRNIDIIMCVDATSSMIPVIEDMKTNAFSFRQLFSKTMEEVYPPTYWDQLRVKVIVFRGSRAESESIAESKFFVLDEEAEAFREFVKGIRVIEDGAGSENSLAALALAMQSDWVRTGAVRRHVIIMYTDTPDLPLSLPVEQPGYHVDNMPENLNEIRKIWDEKMEKRAKRMLIFAPECESLSDMIDWPNTFYTVCKAGADDWVDIATCLILVAQCT